MGSSPSARADRAGLVYQEGIAQSAGTYFDQGRPTAGYLGEVFDRLVWSGLVSVAEGDPLWELRGLSLTEVGAARYAALSAR